MISCPLLMLILIPLFGVFLTILAKYNRYYAIDNVYRVAVWVMGAEVLLALYVFSLLDTEKNGIQIVEKYNWLREDGIDILLGADTFAMLLILSLNLSFLIAGICIEKTIEHPKALVAFELLFISLLNGYFLASDIFSFYIFFASVSTPLIILVSTYGSQRKKNVLVRFSLYNLIGALLLFASIIMIYAYKKSNIPLNTVGNLNLSGRTEYFVWFGIFFAFISRLPVWPFHYWISSINATLRNPLVFIVGNLVPLVGLYGFMRFWPNVVPETVAHYAPYFETACVVTMLFIAIISVSHKEFRYKLFAYTTVCYLMYLIGVFLPTGGLKQNIGYSLFSYIIIVTVLSFLISHIETQKKRLNIYIGNGILCYMPRTSKCISMFVLAGIGLPVTPLFWNNFIIISEIFNYNLVLGILVMLSLFIVALALLEELYWMKDKNGAVSTCVFGGDLSNLRFTLYSVCLIILFFSFFKPLWFVF